MLTHADFAQAYTTPGAHSAVPNTRVVSSLFIGTVESNLRQNKGGPQSIHVDLATEHEHDVSTLLSPSLSFNSAASKPKQLGCSLHEMHAQLDIHGGLLVAVALKALGTNSGCH